MKTFRPVARLLRAATLLALATSPGAQAHDAAPAEGGLVVTPLMAQPLADLPGREGMMLTVELAPGFADTPHRHDAHTFVYVLEGSIVMQVKGGPEVTLGPGQTYYESPTDVHVVGRNASATEKAKFLVVFVKQAGAAPVLPPE